MRKKVGPRLIKEPGQTAFSCPVCQKDFVRSNASIRTAVVYCSRSCSTKAHPKPHKDTTRACLQCAKIFAPKSTGATTATLCSRSCVNTYRSAKAIERRHMIVAPSETEPEHSKSRIYYRPPSMTYFLKKIVREVGHCEKCGAQKRLQGHHIAKYAEYPELGFERSNIMTLCRPCHAMEHPEYAALISSEHGKPKEQFVCKRCGSRMEVYPYLAKTRTYCSRKCQIADLHASAKKGGIANICAQCGASFRTNPSRAAAKFCSNQCRMTALNGIFPEDDPPVFWRDCEECGTPFKVIRARKHLARYCSRRCLGIVSARNKWGKGTFP